MSQYLSAELVDKKNNRVIALMSLSLRIRDMSRDDPFEARYVLDEKKYKGAYKGDDYRGTISVSGIENCLKSKENEVKKYRRKLETTERRLAKAETTVACEDAKNWIDTYEEIIEDLEYDVSALKDWLTFIDYELTWKAHYGKNDIQVDDSNDYPNTLDLNRDDVEINLWLNC